MICGRLLNWSFKVSNPVYSIQKEEQYNNQTKYYYQGKQVSYEEYQKLKSAS